MTEKEKQYFEIMLEQILHEVKTVAEGHSALDNKIERYHRESKADHQLSMDLIKYSHDALKEDIQGVRTELKEDIQGVRTELKEDIQGVRTELKEDIQGVRTELKEDIQGVRTELKETREEMASGFKAIVDKLEGHEDRIRFLERKVA